MDPLSRHRADEFHHILVVDDDPSIVHLVRTKLEQEGFRVTGAYSGPEALAQIRRHGLPHLALVDIAMPEMDGFELAQALQSYADLPIVFLTALDEEETIIRGIEYFAEDYITKPFKLRELVARIRRVLRRIGDFAYTLAPVIQVDDRLAVDFAHQTVYIEGRAVSLTPTETKLLYVLMRNAGQAVSTDFLLRRIWPLDEVYEDTLRVHVHRLRRKLEADPSRPRYIVTERGIGYRLGVKPMAR